MKTLKRNIRRLILNLENVYKISTYPFRTLPDFIIIGAARCGTSFLYSMLNRHPNVIGSPHHEVHFFDHNLWKGINYYRSKLGASYEKWLIKKVRGNAITGEKTPSYLFYPYIPILIKKYLPEAKFIVMLRDPVKRAYSEYQMKVRRGLETLSFEEAVKVERDRALGGLDYDDFFSSNYYPSFNLDHFSYIARSIYVYQLRNWFKHFPRKQFLIIKSEDFYKDQLKVFRKVEKFLGLIPADPPNTLKPLKFEYKPISPKTAEFLRSFFEKYNEMLYKLLNWESGW